MVKELFGDLFFVFCLWEFIDLSVVNLEMLVIMNDEFWSRKGVCYRVLKENCFDVLVILCVDVLMLVNNYILDFGIKGLIDIFDVIDLVFWVGVGRNDF